MITDIAILIGGAVAIGVVLAAIIAAQHSHSHICLAIDGYRGLMLWHCPAGCDLYFGPKSAHLEGGGRDCPACGVPLEFLPAYTGRKR